MYYNAICRWKAFHYIKFVSGSYTAHFNNSLSTLLSSFDYKAKGRNGDCFRGESLTKANAVVRTTEHVRPLRYQNSKRRRILTAAAATAAVSLPLFRVPFDLQVELSDLTLLAESIA